MKALQITGTDGEELLYFFHRLFGNDKDQVVMHPDTAFCRRNDSFIISHQCGHHDGTFDINIIYG